MKVAAILMQHLIGSVFFACWSWLTWDAWIEDLGYYPSLEFVLLMSIAIVYTTVRKYNYLIGNSNVR